MIDPKRWQAAFRDPRLLLMVGLGFASGLPNPLSHSTLKAWLTSLHFDLGIIGLFAFVRLPYNIKFLWAPFVDRYALPFLSRRRGWIFFCQLVLFLAIGALGSQDPSQGWWLTWVLALNVAFFGATLDICADAYRTDLLPAGERTNGTAVWVSAFRIALIVSGAGALILSDIVPWSVVYWIMAGLMLVTCLVTLWAEPIPARIKPPATFRDAVIIPVHRVHRSKGCVSASPDHHALPRGRGRGGSLPHHLSHGARVHPHRARHLRQGCSASDSRSSARSSSSGAGSSSAGVSNAR